MITHLRFKRDVFLSVFLFLTCKIACPLFAQTLTGQAGLPTNQAVVTLSSLSPVTDAGAGPPATPTNFLAVADNGTQDPPFPGGAVGPNHVVSTLDHVIRIQNRTGSNLFTVSVTNFWAATGPYSDPRGAFDPKAVYDPYNDRWLMTAVADYNTNTSAVLVGVTQTGDPSGAWNLYRVNINTNAVAPKWANYPNIGFNKDWVVVAITAYDIGDGAQDWQLYTFSKTNLYANGDGAYRRFGNADTATYGVVQEPCATYDNTISNLYLVTEISGNDAGNGLLRLFYIDGLVGAEVLHVGADVSTPNPWDVAPPTCDFGPQLGSSRTICLDDSRLQNAVYRNGSIWTTHTIFLPAGAVTRSAIQWWQISPAGTIQQRGRIDDPSGHLFYAFPSIAVNQLNDSLIGCARFSDSSYASAYYALRLHTDANNTFETPVLLKAGEATFTRSNPPLRWGDHTSTVVDPTNDQDFWTIQEYAAFTNSQSLWGTWWGKVTVIEPTAPTANFTGSPTAGIHPLTVTFTDTSSGTITNRFWNFGDGGTTNTAGTSVVRQYVSTGTYTVVLIASGPVGVSTNSKSAYIIVTNIPPQLAVTPASRDFGTLPVGQSSTQDFSVVNNGIDNLSGTAAVTGGGFLLLSGSPFNVSGGQTSTVTVTFTPGSAGSFSGRVVFASNGGASTNPLAGAGAASPVAAFTANPTNGTVSLTVNFTDASSGTITGRVWTFGDGGNSIATNPSHTFTNAGTFSVGLIVSGPTGSGSLTRSNYITVTNVIVAAPIAGFTASPTNGAAPLSVSFTDASAGTITSRSWNFGDGGISSATNPSHTFTNAGAFSVSLTVRGPGGSKTLTRSNYITVTNVVNLAPSVSIVRPADGMAYPPLTNLSINIIANASDSNGISKIEFFDGANKLGQSLSSPATNVLNAPSFGNHVLTARAINTLGVTNTSTTVTINVGTNNSPLGNWEVTVKRADRGIGFLTFTDDAKATGYGIRRGMFGLVELSGQWSFDAKGRVAGLFAEELGSGTNWTGVLSEKAKSLKSFNGSVTTSNAVFRWESIPATAFPDLSGTWTGQVTVAKIPTVIEYAIRTNATNSGVFDVATTAATNTVIGQLIVTSHNKVDGYISIASKQATLSGAFKGAHLSLSLKGTNEDGALVKVRVAKE
jgi:PKD repeat protein